MCGRRENPPPAVWRILRGNQMVKVPNELREIIARNIRNCRSKKFPGRGGAKKCAETFGVSPQQWSPWERGMRTPDEMRLEQLADFFGVSVEYLRRDNQAEEKRREPEWLWGLSSGGGEGAADGASDAGGSVVYVPVFVILPRLPEQMQGLYDQFNAALNGGLTPGKAAD